MKKLAVKFKGNEILGVDDFDVSARYRHLWKTGLEKWNSVRQGIIHSGACNESCMKLQMDAKELPKPDTKYKIADVSSEYEIVTQPDLMGIITTEYQRMALPYSRGFRDRQIPINKLDTTCSWSFNMPCKSLKGILVLFQA